MFVSHLAQDGLAYQTIKVYLSAVHNFHITAGLHKEFVQQLTPRLEMVLRGIKKDKAGTATQSRLPITIEIMAKLKDSFSRNPTDYNNIMMWAACSLAFFGFLWCSEFTVPSQQEYTPTDHLSLQDISVDSRKFPTLILTFLRYASFYYPNVINQYKAFISIVNLVNVIVLGPILSQLATI